MSSHCHSCLVEVLFKHLLFSIRRVNYSSTAVWRSKPNCIFSDTSWYDIIWQPGIATLHQF
jgi:hypothetical protein